MADTVYTYEIVSVDKSQVISKIAQYGYHIFAVKIADNTVIQSDGVSADELKNMTSTTDYLYFYIKQRENK